MGPLKEWLIVRKPVISDNCHPLARRCLEKMKFMSNSIVKGDDKVDMTLSCQHFFNFTNHKVQSAKAVGYIAGKAHFCFTKIRT